MVMNLKVIFKDQGSNISFAESLSNIAGYPYKIVGNDLAIDLTSWPEKFNLFETTIKGKLRNNDNRKDLFQQISDVDEERMYKEFLHDVMRYKVYHRYGFIADLHARKFEIFSSTSKNLPTRLEAFYQLINKDCNWTA